MPTPATSTSSPSPARNAAPICPIRQPSANCTPTPADEKWIDLGAWHGLVVSSKVKDDRIAALEPLIEKAMKDPEVIEKFNKIGLDAGYLPAKEFGQLIQSSSDLADEVLAGRKSLD